MPKCLQTAFVSWLCPSAILVTGASGYIGSHVVQQLLAEGRRVRGTVRSLQNREKVEALRALVPNSRHPLELVEAELNEDEGWDR